MHTTAEARYQVQDIEAFAEECAFHPGLMIAAARALTIQGGTARATVLSCLEEDEEQYVWRAQCNINIQNAASKGLLATMSLLPAGALIPTAVVARILKG